MIRFTILQIDHKLDNRNYLFMPQEFLLAHGDPFPPPRKIYEEVYSECQPKFDPEAVFTRFNINHPEDYRGRSLSISDIVRYHLPGGDILDLYCDHVGYVGVDLRQGYEVAKEPEYIPASDRTSDVVSLFYNKSGKMKTVSVNISHLFPKRCTGIDENGDTVTLTPAQIYNVLRTCEMGRNEIRRKEQVKSLTGWQDSYLPEFGDYFTPGDFVTQSVVDHYLNILPPVNFRQGYLQAGGPICHLKNEKGIPRACYMTFIKPDTEWIYAGVCFEGRDENQVPVKTLNEKFIHLMGGTL